MPGRRAGALRPFLAGPTAPVASGFRSPSLAQESPDAMIGQTLRTTVEITNPQGLHMRPATAFALLAGKFKSEVRVFNEDRSADGKSLLELFTLVVLPGAQVTIEVSGPDAGDALAALVEVINRPVEEPADPPPSLGA